MIIHANIDQNDIAEARRGAKRGRAASLVRLGFSFGLLVFVTLYELLNLYRAFSAFGRNVNQRFGAPFAEQAIAFGADMGLIFVNLIVLALVGLLWAFLYRAITALRRGTSSGLKHKRGLSTGKILIDMSEKHLVVKTPLKVQKIAWAAFESFEETKTSLVFHYPDGRFEFVPKNALPAKSAVEKICEELRQRIDCPLSRGVGEEAAALKLSYEFADKDNDEFRRWSRRERGKGLSLMRRLTASPRFILVAISFLSLLSGASLWTAAARSDLSLLGAGLAYAAAAGVLALTHREFFSRTLAGFRRTRSGLYAQTDPTTVTISKTGVFRESRGAIEVYQWDAFDHLVLTKSAAYLMLGPENAIALPRRAFMDETHYDRLVGFATVRLAEAKRAKNTTQMQRLEKSAVKPSAAAKPIPQKSRQSEPERSDDNPAAPAHTRPTPIHAARAR